MSWKGRVLMFIIPTLREFMDNPMGKGSNAIPSRQLVRDDLTRRLGTVLRHKDKKITVDIYKDGDHYFYHLTIPSESEDRRNTYDVVLEFFADELPPGVKKEKNMNHYQVRFFSNSPSFTYTYAYAFDLYGFFIKELSNKYRVQVLDNPPVTRNPAEVINYEKSIFFAVSYLLQHPRFLDKTYIETSAKRLTKEIFQRKIRTTDLIEMQIKQEEQRLKREREKDISKREVKQREPRLGTVGKTQARGGIRKIEKIKPKGKIRPRR
ncbi:hypothetical protein D1872_37950 [compost metagenome]